MKLAAWKRVQENTGNKSSREYLQNIQNSEIAISNLKNKIKKLKDEDNTITY